MIQHVDYPPLGGCYFQKNSDGISEFPSFMDQPDSPYGQSKLSAKGRNMYLIDVTVAIIAHKHVFDTSCTEENPCRAGYGPVQDEKSCMTNPTFGGTKVTSWGTVKNFDKYAARGCSSAPWEFYLSEESKELRYKDNMGNRCCTTGTFNISDRKT